MLSNDARFAWPALVLLAVVLAGVMFVLPLGIGFPLLDPDEGLHASIAQEMVERGDWVTPTFLGQRFLDKPIFYSWVQALSLRWLGPTETAVRLPGLLFGLLGAATTGLLAWRMFDRATGLIAGILYATTILPTALAQAASHDVALIPAINLTLLLLWESERATLRRTAIASVAGAGALLGLSILIKGLVGVGVVGLAYGSYSLISRRGHAIRRGSGKERWDGSCTAVSGLPAEGRQYNCHLNDNCRPNRDGFAVLLRGAAVLIIAVLIASPWYALVEVQNPGYLRYFFLDRHLLGLVTATQPHANQPWWYYLPILIGGGLPWIGYLPIVVQEGLARRRSGNASADAPPTLLLWCWLIGWTLLLMAARSKLATYLWPVFPPVAILAAVAWARRIGGTLSATAQRSFARTFVWSSWTGPIVLPAAVLAVQVVFAVEFAWPVWVVVVLVAAAAPLPLLPWYAGRRQASLAAAALSLAAQFVVVMTMVLPPVAETFSARELAEHFNQVGRVPPRLLVAEERIGSFVFYLDPQLRTGLKEGQLEKLLPQRLPTLREGDVIALPEQKVSRAGEYLDLAQSPYESVGRFRLYHVRANAVVARP